jgi:hypothetical protein
MLYSHGLGPLPVAGGTCFGFVAKAALTSFLLSTIKAQIPITKAHGQAGVHGNRARMPAEIARR